MEKIFSKINNQFFHQIVRLSFFVLGRINLSVDEKYMQCAAMNLPKGATFKPHKHNMNSRHDENCNRIRVKTRSYV